MGSPRAPIGFLAILVFIAALLWLANPAPEFRSAETRRERLSRSTRAEFGQSQQRSMTAKAKPAEQRSDAPQSTQHRVDATTAEGPEPIQPTEAETPPSYASLDDAPPEFVRARLEEAIGRATRQRAFYFAPGLVETVARERRIRVIFDTVGGADQVAAMLAGSARGENADFDELRLYTLLPYGAAEVGPQALLHLIEAPDVEGIEADSVYRQMLAESGPIVGADLAHAGGHRGQGFAVAVIDTGVDTAHPMFDGRVLTEACFSLVSDCPNGEPEMLGPGAGAPCPIGCEHGTHVASVAVGLDSVSGLTGLAPQSALIAIRVFSNLDGEIVAFSSDVLAALEYVAMLSAINPIASVNLSLGGELFSDPASCDLANGATKTAIDLLISLGIATVAAAGNEGLTNALSAPACISSAISVGATTKSDEVADFTNSAEFLDLLAPGTAIVSADPGGGLVVRSRTSIAAPHVSGAVAVVRSAEPSGGVQAIVSAFRLSGTPILDPGNGFTFMRLDVARAIELLALAPESPSAPENPAAAAASPAALASPASASGGSSGCGLIGLEILIVPLIARWLGGRRSAAGTGFARNQP